jgi:hypothetical protein
VDYLENNFELDIRYLDKWLRKPLPKAFATALDENPSLWCEITQLLAAKPPFRPPLMCGSLDAAAPGLTDR